MQTHQYQLTFYLLDDQARPAIAAPGDGTPPPKTRSIREAAHLYACTIKDLPVAEQPTRAPALRPPVRSGRLRTRFAP